MSASEDTELSDREWRQMRRTMSKLEFEPVPETPSLLPRSLYTDTPSKSAVLNEHSAREVDSSWKSDESLPSSPASSVASTRAYPKGILKVGAAMATLPRGELPSTSSTLPLHTTSRTTSIDSFSSNSHKRVDIRDHGDSRLDPQLAAIGGQMSAAHEAIQDVVMSAFAELQSRLIKERTMERLQLAASHSTDISLLQSKIDELKEQIVAHEKQGAVYETVVDRLTSFTAKYRAKEHAYFVGDQSITSCFRAWEAAVVRAKAKRLAIRRADHHYTKRLVSFTLREWRESTRDDALRRELEQVQAEHERRVVEIAKEYQLKVEQLQRELEESIREVSSLKKCRLQLEEDLRQVFLRGVSSMNIEALQVFNTRRQDQVGNDGNAVSVNDLRTGAPLENIPDHENHHRPESSLDAADPDSLSPELIAPIPRPSDTLHSLDSNLQRLLKLSSKLSSDDSRVSKVNRDDVAARAHQARVQPTPSPQSWARPRSFSSSTSAPASTSFQSGTLRSAEMVQQHQMGTLGMQGRSSTSTPYVSMLSNPNSSAHNRFQGQSSAKLQVEVEFLRSALTSSVSKPITRRPSMPISGRWKRS